MKDLPTLLKLAWDYRRDFVKKEKWEAFRLVNGRGDSLSDLIVDVYGGSFLAVFKDPRWNSQKELLSAALQDLSGKMNLSSPFRLFEFKNFSKTPSRPSYTVNRTTNETQETRVVKEGELRFEIHLGEGLHTGLFLDQRKNRRLLGSLAKGKRVLNLFSYTGAFTISALKGGAREAVSVDLSKNYLGWLKRNLEINGLDSDPAPLFAADVFRFLKGAAHRKENYDLIIVDPPTFSRGEKGTFSTDKNLEELVSEAAGLLTPGGKIFVSVNTQGLTPAQFRGQVASAVHPFGLTIKDNFSMPEDFRLSPEEEKNPPLKSCLAS
jgi:23S rRNA (cytosine1962-C5)-methyltransferase